MGSSFTAPNEMRNSSRWYKAEIDGADKLDYLKSRLYGGFGVEVRQDLQLRAEIIIQPKPGRWMFTPDELNDLTEGLNSILLSSNPEAGWPFRLTLKQYIGLFGP